MHTLRLAIGVVWIVFWVVWLGSAFTAKAGRGGRRRFPVFGLSAVSVFIVERGLRHSGTEVHSTGLAVAGVVVFAAGLGLALWARVYLGRNWGMPMTEKAEPELVTSGPYRFVRHPIYSGLLLALVGTSLANDLLGLIVVAILGAYFSYAATVEERNLTATFPTAYPGYRAHTKMLIPFVF
jgi:protein-S-isoprenylcysteine O-methyltransferase Ste14